MKIPKSIYINNNLWTTVYKWNLKYDKEECVGLCDKKKKIIYLLRGMTAAEKTETYLHELFHALCCEYGISEILPIGAEEIMVEIFAQFLANNMSIRWKKNVE